MSVIEKNPVQQFEEILLDDKYKWQVIDILHRNPKLCFEALGKLFNLSHRFESITNYPQQVKNFSDLSFLFACSQLNMGIITMALDEAAYLYDLIGKREDPSLVEIGRFKGGSTFLMAAAKRNKGILKSYDIHVKMTDHFNGKEMDESLLLMLKKYELDEGVSLFIEDSASASNEEGSVDLVFFDGDHSYEGIKKDFLHWYPAIKEGGDLVFHDATDARQFAESHLPVKEFLADIQKESRYELELIQEVGTVSHFRKGSHK